MEEDQEPNHAKIEAAFRKAFALEKGEGIDVEIEEKHEEGKEPTYSISATLNDGDFILASGANVPRLLGWAFSFRAMRERRLAFTPVA